MQGTVRNCWGAFQTTWIATTDQLLELWWFSCQFFLFLLGSTEILIIFFSNKYPSGFEQVPIKMEIMDMVVRSGIIWVEGWTVVEQSLKNIR